MDRPVVTPDYVVVGGGAAGCVLAARLSEDPAVSVLLVEDGGRARGPLVSVPRAFPYALRSDRLVHRYATRGSAATPQEWWIRGRGLGGSTAVNGLMYVRGHRHDHDALARTVGDERWGWDAWRAAYEALESGPLTVTVPGSGDAVSAAVIEAAGRLGVGFVADVNRADGDRIGYTPATIAGGRRVSAASAFLRPAMRRPNLHVITGARVERVVLERGRATGVEVRHRSGRLESIAARREVVLSAGAIESPLLLERSGIGRPDVLRAAGIEPLVTSDRVGEGLLEHRGISVQVRFAAPYGPTPRLHTRAGRVGAAARYLGTRQGPLASGGYDVVSAFGSPGAERPDVQGVWVPLAIDETRPQLAPAPYPGLLFTGYAVRPTTAGSVHVGGPGADAPPLIDPRYLEDTAEQRATVAAFRHARAVIAASDLAPIVDAEVFPGTALTEADDVVAHARAHGGGIYHSVGTCAMGSDSGAVADTDLRVNGVDRLRVVDASVLPHHVSGNTAAPVMALAWLAADRLLTSR